MCQDHISVNFARKGAGSGVQFRIYHWEARNAKIELQNNYSNAS